MKGALRELNPEVDPSLRQELELFATRYEKALQDVIKFGPKTDWQAEMNQTYHHFRTTFENNKLHKHISLDELHEIARKEELFGKSSDEEREKAYLRKIGDVLHQQLSSHDADDIMYVPLHAMYLPYGVMKSGKGKPKRSRKTRLVERLINGKESIVIVRGLPGTGKSVAMRQMAYRLASKALHFEKGNIPILIPLAEARKDISEDKDWVLEIVREFLMGKSFEDRELRFMMRYLEQRLTSLLNSGRCTIIFDGMDELPRRLYDERCRALLRFATEWTRNRNNKFVFSCREFDYPRELQIDSLVLFPFNWNDVESFLQTHLPAPIFEQRRKEARQAWEQGGPAKALLDNPFFLHLATRHILDRPTELLPLNRGMLFDAYVKRIFRFENELDATERSRREKVAELVETLALWISDRKISGTRAVWSDLASETEGQLIASELRKLQDDSTLPYFISIDSDGLTFRHHRLREFFAARALKRTVFLDNSPTMN